MTCLHILAYSFAFQRINSYKLQVEVNDGSQMSRHTEMLYSCATQLVITFDQTPVR